MSAIPPENDARYQSSLTELCIDSGIEAINPHWHYVDDVDKLDTRIKATCSAQLKFIEEFKVHWASTDPHSLSIPQEWIVILEKEPTIWNLQEWMQSAALMTWLRDVEKKWLAPSEVESMHNSLLSFAPDFLLRSPRCTVPRYQGDPPFSLNPFYSLPFFMEVVTYPGDEDNATLAIPGIFLITPGCNLVSKLESDFPPPLRQSDQDLPGGFGLLMKPFVSFPSVDEMKANLFQPALLVGMKGPSPWPSPSGSPPLVTPSVSLDDKIHDLSKVLQSNLAAHLVNWHLRCQQNVQAVFSLPGISSSCLPPWFMLFGILYDADGLIIVAHIPYRPDPSSTSMALGQTAQYSYLSCIIDRIPMTGAVRPSSLSADRESPILSNFRAALALLALQRHAFMITALWERVSWPTSVIHLFQDADFDDIFDANVPGESRGVGEKIPGENNKDESNQHYHDYNGENDEDKGQIDGENDAGNDKDVEDKGYMNNENETVSHFEENDGGDPRGEAHSHGGHRAENDNSDDPAGNVEDSTDTGNSDDEDDSSNDPVHGVVVHRGTQVDLVARVSQRERMKIAIPQWLHKTSPQ